MIFTSSFLTAQAGKIPPFQVMQANGKVFKAENLPMGKPVILIYFSPDCSHCQQFMESFFKEPAKFEKASVAMITFVPLEQVSTFSKQYHLAKHSNIFTGTEGNTFFVKNYYRLIEMPFVALYNKNGDFIESYVREINLKVVASKLNTLR